MVSLLKQCFRTPKDSYRLKFQKGGARDGLNIVRKDEVYLSRFRIWSLPQKSPREDSAFMSHLLLFSLPSLEHCICPCGQMSRGYQPSMGLGITKRKQWCLDCGSSTNWPYDYGTHFPSLNPSLLISEVKGQGWFISRVFFFPFEVSESTSFSSSTNSPCSLKSLDAGIIFKLYYFGV